MNKLFIFLLIAVSIFFSLGFGSRTVADKNQSAFVNRMVTAEYNF